VSDLTVSALVGEVLDYRYNPGRIFQTAIGAAERIHNGEINIVGATNPFVYGIENTAINVAAFMQENAANTRAMYALCAVEEDDLYRHMSDKDYINRFSTPASATFTLVFAKNELAEAVIYDPNEDYERIIIPRNSYFKIAGITFSLQYPIEIRKFSYGGYQIVYLNDKPSPLEKLTTNILPFSEVTDSAGIQWITFDVVVKQFFISTSYMDISMSSGMKTSVSLTDQFYHLRCFLQKDDLSWTEILTTHNQQLFDPLTATAVIKVLAGQVSVSIPIVYISSGLVSGKLRIDLYQTKGPLDIALGEYPIDQYEVGWHSTDSNDYDKYVSATMSLSSVVTYSQSRVSGGRSSLSFEELKTRVKSSSTGVQDLPITSVQMHANMADSGYGVVLHVDSLTNRVYWATKPMPTASDIRVLTAASSQMLTINTTMAELALAHDAYDNGDRITLQSSALYQTTDGVSVPVSKDNYRKILSMDSVSRCRHVTEGRYSYSPFAYVFDATNEAFEIRPYYLDNPKLISKNFVEENPTTHLQVSISPSYELTRTSAGYNLKLITYSGSDYRKLDDEQVFCQLSFVSQSKNTRVFLYGIQSRMAPGGERVFVFKIDSNFDVDINDKLYLTSLANEQSGILISCNLTQEFDIVFGTTANLPSGFKKSGIDDLMGSFQLGVSARGISHEKITLKFGDPLKYLWAASRSSLGSLEYQRYDTDIVDVYEKDEYAIDPTTGSIFSVVNGELQYNIDNYKGQIKYGTDGKPLIKHAKGDVVYDQYDQPLLINGMRRKIQRFCDIMTVEGVYHFATAPSVVEYRNRISEFLLEWIINEVPSYQGKLLDQTKIFFYPRVNAGTLSVISADNSRAIINAGQSLKIKLTVPPSTMQDESLKEALTSKTIRVIDQELKKSVVSASQIQAKLLESYSTDVIDANIIGLGVVASSDQSTFTVLDEQSRCSIRKRLAMRSDRLLVVEEDINIVFVRHGSET
jgi:hypothetical protein